MRNPCIWKLFVNTTTAQGQIQLRKSTSRQRYKFGRLHKKKQSGIGLILQQNVFNRSNTTMGGKEVSPIR